MNMFEEAEALLGMIKMTNMTQTEIARKLGVSQSYVANKLRLLRLPCRVKAEILDKGLCERQARSLLRLTSESDMLGVIERIKSSNMTVAESDVAVDLMVEYEAPKRLMQGEMQTRLDKFEDFLDKSLESLSSIGISTVKQSEISGDKRYITIMIDEKAKLAISGK